MGLLDGGLANVFASVFSGIYLDGMLYRPTRTDVKGTVTEAWDAGQPVKVQPDLTTERMQGAAGYTSKDIAIFILAKGVADPTTDAEVQILTGPHAGRWKIASSDLDPAGAAWLCRGQPA